MVKDAGFASLPAAMKYLFAQMKNGNVDLSYVRRPVKYLTKSQADSLLNDIEEFEVAEKRGEVFQADSIEDFIKQLNED